MLLAYSMMWINSTHASHLHLCQNRIGNSFLPSIMMLIKYTWTQDFNAIFTSTIDFGLKSLRRASRFLLLLLLLLVREIFPPFSGGAARGFWLEFARREAGTRANQSTNPRGKRVRFFQASLRWKEVGSRDMHELLPSNKIQIGPFSLHGLFDWKYE